jgi:hypothetical protein
MTNVYFNCSVSTTSHQGSQYPQPSTSLQRPFSTFFSIYSTLTNLYTNLYTNLQMQPEVFFVGSIELSWFLRKQKNSRKGVLCCSFVFLFFPAPFLCRGGQRDSRKGSAVPLCIALSHTGFRLCPLTDALKGIQASTASTLAIPGQHSLCVGYRSWFDDNRKWGNG